MSSTLQNAALNIGAPTNLNSARGINFSFARSSLGKLSQPVEVLLQKVWTTPHLRTIFTET
jgi:hypothetical protein